MLNKVIVQSKIGAIGLITFVIIVHLLFLTVTLS